MKNTIARFLSHDAGPVAQFVKYGAIGVAATCVQTGFFYVAACWLRCLTPDDWAVKLLGCPAATFTGALTLPEERSDGQRYLVPV